MTNPTDTNQASELYELCKEVYERFPDWVVTEYPSDWIMTEAPNNRGGLNKACPLYTSDYLLEKLNELPFAVNVHNLNSKWMAAYQLGAFTEPKFADTPLKALLKLTIALSEAGELNE